MNNPVFKPADKKPHIRHFITEGICQEIFVSAMQNISRDVRSLSADTA
ncbi:Uncharacterised protein [Hafnia alvei]|nr:Uncharacterised protein [Hafnia alvei]